MRNTLGEFEQAVLLAILRLGSSAYGVPIRHDLSLRLGRAVSVGATYTALERLEGKGLFLHGLATRLANAGVEQNGSTA